MRNPGKTNGTRLSAHSHVCSSRIVTNAVVRSKGDKMSYFGHEIARCKDYSSLHYRLPFEKVRTDYFLPQKVTQCILAGLSRGLGRAKSCLGWHFFRRSPWGKKLTLSSIHKLIWNDGNIGWYHSVFSADHGTILQPTQYTRRVRSTDIWGVRIQFLPSMYP